MRLEITIEISERGRSPIHSPPLVVKGTVGKFYSSITGSSSENYFALISVSCNPKNILKSDTRKWKQVSNNSKVPSLKWAVWVIESALYLEFKNQNQNPSSAPHIHMTMTSHLTSQKGQGHPLNPGPCPVILAFVLSLDSDGCGRERMMTLLSSDSLKPNSHTGQDVPPPEVNGLWEWRTNRNLTSLLPGLLFQLFKNERSGLD